MSTKEEDFMRVMQDAVKRLHNLKRRCAREMGNITWFAKEVGRFNDITWSVRKVSDRTFLCEHLMDYNLARLHEPTLNLSAHA